jgi:DNA-binding NarL/FixJ family response regulator
MTTDKGMCYAGIMLIDDHPAFRQGLALLLSQDGYRICGEAGNRGEVLSFLEKSRAGMALLDISLGEEDGLDLIPDMRQFGVVALVYSMHEDPDVIERAFNAGAMGYVTKRETADVLLDAVAAVLDGKRYISPRCALSIASRVVSGGKTEHDASLSEREKQVLRMLGNGESITEIAATLSIGSRTVESYLSRIMDKLKLDGMKELRRYAINNNRQ